MKRLLVSQYQRVKSFYFKYERWLMPLTLLGGFLLDYITFTSINIAVTFSLLVFYWLLAAATIVCVNLYDAGKLSQKFRYARLFAPLVLQFTFGALLGSSLVFYWLSGTFSASWPIILIIALLMVFNDIFRSYFLRPTLQAGLFFFITFSLLSLLLPFLFKSLETQIFVLAGALSMAIFCSFMYALGRAGGYTYRQQKHILLWASGIFLVMNIFYFTNIIPPIPLFLREAGLYHSLTSANGKYTLKGEKETWLDAIIPGQTVHLTQYQKLYLYTAIFAPDELNTTISHHWQYYNEILSEWSEPQVLSFKIFGGRKEGYKGYSFVSNLAVGKWRVFVKNERGQILGRVTFNVERVQGQVELQETVR